MILGRSLPRDCFKDSLILHCLFRVSLATQHIIGTIIFPKQRVRKKNSRIRVISSLNLRAESAGAEPRLRAHARLPPRALLYMLATHVGVVHHLSALRGSTGRPFRSRLAARERVRERRLKRKKNTKNKRNIYIYAIKRRNFLSTNCY